MGPSPRVVTNAFPGFPSHVGGWTTHSFWGSISVRSAGLARVLVGSECARARLPCLDTTGTILAGAPLVPTGYNQAPAVSKLNVPFGLARLSVHSVWVVGACAASLGRQAGPAELSCTGCLARLCLSSWVPGPYRGRTLFRQLSLPSPTALGVREFSEY